MPGGLHPPLSVIESWPSSSHHSRSASRHGVVAMACVLMVLSLLVVAARLRARSLRKNYDWDDYLLLASMVSVNVALYGVLALNGQGTYDRVDCHELSGYVDGSHKSKMTTTDVDSGLEEYGFGRHIWELKLPILLDTRKVGYKSEPPPSLIST
jgi:hypothetical protein